MNLLQVLRIRALRKDSNQDLPISVYLRRITASASIIIVDAISAIFSKAALITWQIKLQSL
jgi:hypothetical protein